MLAHNRANKLFAGIAKTTRTFNPSTYLFSSDNVVGLGLTARNPTDDESRVMTSSYDVCRVCRTQLFRRDQLPSGENFLLHAAPEQLTTPSIMDRLESNQPLRDHGSRREINYADIDFNGKIGDYTGKMCSACVGKSAMQTSTSMVRLVTILGKCALFA